MTDKNNALAELARFLEDESKPVSDAFREKIIKVFGVAAWNKQLERKRKFYKCSRIVAELAKEFEPIDPDSVKPSEDGRKHLADFIKAGDKRRCDIMIKCRAIAEEGVDDGNRRQRLKEEAENEV